MRRGGRRAFTLIEVLIAFLLLSIVTYILYTFMIRGSSTAVAGIWRKATNERLQQTAERMRKAIESASFPSILAPEGNFLDETNTDHYVALKQGPVTQDLYQFQQEASQDTGDYQNHGPGDLAGTYGNGDAAPQVFLVTTQCSPGRQRMEGLAPPDLDGTCTRHWFWLTNPRPVNRGGIFSAVMELRHGTEEFTYDGGQDLDAVTSIAAGGAPGMDAPPMEGKVLVHDVNLVQVRATDGEGADAALIPGDPLNPDENPNPSPGTVEVYILCVDSDGGKATLGKRIRAQPNSGIQIR